jgi:hypothetical protein
MMTAAKHWDHSRIEMNKGTEKMEKKEEGKSNLNERRTSGESK